MDTRKKYLNSEDFKEGLRVLDRELGNYLYIVAFTPLKLITAGGFLAVTHLKNRDMTGDLDYLIDPELEDDDDIKKQFQEAIEKTAKALDFYPDWANSAMKMFVSAKTKEMLFRDAEKQNLVLFEGEHIIVRAAPLEWALERKLRRIYAADRGRKAELDVSDALALLKAMRDDKGGPLDREHIRTLNANGFDIVPDARTMDFVAKQYREKYGEEPFA